VVVPLVVLLAAFVAAPSSVLAQNKLLTLDDLYDPVKKVDFGTTRSTREVTFDWINDTEYVRKGDDGRYYRVQAASGTESPVFDPARLEQALSLVPGVTVNDRGKLPKVTFASDYSALVCLHENDLY
jgi:hypothetical protein